MSRKRQQIRLAASSLKRAEIEPELSLELRTTLANRTAFFREIAAKAFRNLFTLGDFSRFTSNKTIHYHTLGTACEYATVQKRALFKEVQWIDALAEILNAYHDYAEDGTDIDVAKRLDALAPARQELLARGLPPEEYDAEWARIQESIETQERRALRTDRIKECVDFLVNTITEAKRKYYGRRRSINEFFGGIDVEGVIWEFAEKITLGRRTRTDTGDDYLDSNSTIFQMRSPVATSVVATYFTEMAKFSDRSGNCGHLFADTPEFQSLVSLPNLRGRRDSLEALIRTQVGKAKARSELRIAAAEFEQATLAAANPKEGRPLQSMSEEKRIVEGYKGLLHALNSSKYLRHRYELMQEGRGVEQEEAFFDRSLSGLQHMLQRESEAMEQQMLVLGLYYPLYKNGARQNSLELVRRNVALAKQYMLTKEAKAFQKEAGKGKRIFSGTMAYLAKVERKDSDVADFATNYRKQLRHATVLKQYMDELRERVAAFQADWRTYVQERDWPQHLRTVAAPDASVLTLIEGDLRQVVYGRRKAA